MALPPKAPPRPGAPPPPEPVEDRSRHATNELADACAALEAEVEELKARYEMYFLGVDRAEPNRTRDELKKKVLRLKERFTRNAGIRFRVQSLHARFISYERLWLRSAREKEEGTYRRDLFKARLHASQRAAGPAGVKGKKEVLRFSQAEDVDLTDFGDQPPPAPPPRPAVPAPAPAASAPLAASKPAITVPLPALTPAPGRAVPGATTGSRPAVQVDPQTRALYDAYVAARRACNQDLTGITPDAIARTIAKQTPEILKAHKARTVEFKVEVRDGKAVLKAVPRS